MNPPATDSQEGRLRRAFVRGDVVIAALPEAVQKRLGPQRLSRKQSRDLRKQLLAKKCRTAGVKTPMALAQSK